VAPADERGADVTSGAPAVTIRVVVVDDQPLARSGLRTIIDGEPDLSVVGDAADGREGLALIERAMPDVAVMDLRMPVLDGIEATARIVAAGLPVQVLVLTTFDDEQLVHEALRAGASGFLLKDASPDRMVAAIRTVHEGHAVLAPEVTRAVIARGTKPAQPRRSELARVGELTAREREILIIVGRGLSNRDIGRRLFVSEGTVKTHVSNILAKTGCHSRAQAVALAYDTGLIVPVRDQGSVGEPASRTWVEPVDRVRLRRWTAAGEAGEPARIREPGP
jgi:DNA-binding NarL/FixJ family response regulator